LSRFCKGRGKTTWAAAKLAKLPLKNKKKIKK